MRMILWRRGKFLKPFAPNLRYNEDTLGKDVSMFDVLNRIRTFNLRKVTPVQWVMVAVGILIALWILNTLLSIAATLMPIAIVAILAYVGYRVLSSRGEDAAAIQQAKREEKFQQADDSTIKAAKQVNTVIATKLEKAPASERLADEVTVNPETGVTEVNIARLEEEESQKLKQTKQKADPEEIQRQLEERRKRLLGGQ